MDKYESIYELYKHSKIFHKFNKYDLHCTQYSNTELSMCVTYLI